MKPEYFGHLHLHDMYSYLDGCGMAQQYIKRAVEIGNRFIGITNHGNVDGNIKFQKACEESRIIPIHGCELYLVSNPNVKSHEKKYHATVWVKNDVGWANLLNLLSRANLYGFHYRPRVGYEDFVNHCEGLVIGTACVSSFIHDPNGIDVLKALIARTDVFGEIMPHHTEEQKITNDAIISASRELGFDLIATNDVHWVFEEDSETQQVLLAINNKSKWNDPKRFKFDSAYKCHFKTPHEMIDEFKNMGVPREIYATAMRNTVDVAKMCKNFRVKRRDVTLPKVTGFDYYLDDDDEILRQLCIDLYHDNISILFDPKYEKRLNEELDIIKKKGLSRYFLLVYDIVKWCKENDVMIGPRGSAGCSLVNYILGVTIIDPIKYNLPFSRFLNEERIDLADIDLDVDKHKRQMVIQHIRDLYGEYSTVAISTYDKMKARLVLRDVARVFDVDIREVDAVSKSIDGDLSDFLNTDLGVEFERKYPHIIKHAMKLEGHVRHAGMHAAGIIVTDHDLSKSDRCNLVSRSKGIAVNWDKDDAEYCGLMKLDILGLATLSVLDEAKRLIKQNHKVDIDFNKIPLDDERVFNDVSNGNFVSIFQMGYAIQDVVRRSGISNIKEWSDAIALGRPGPADSGETDLYIARKKGQPWEKKHYLYEEIMEDTYSTFCYQEQIISIFNKMAGFSYAKADQIRRIIGKKKDPKEFEAYKEDFIQGCLDNKTFSVQEAEEFWESLLKCANYLFNRSHSLAYAIIGYWCAYLRYYYPVEFICAALTYDDKTDRNELLSEARRLGLKVMTPKIGISDARRWISKDKKLYAPFIEIKGFGETTSEKVANGRSKIGADGTLVFTKKIMGVLEDIKAFDKDCIEDIPNKYFEFTVQGDVFKAYPNLTRILQASKQSVSEGDIYNALKCELELDLIRKISPYKQIVRKNCSLCHLQEEAKRTVPYSPGEYNIMICGEAPGFHEEQQLKGFVGRAGAKLWEELEKYNLYRSMFHITNCCKCFPSKTRTPTVDDVNICCDQWLDKEIELVKPAIILALGNLARYRFTGEECGISKVSGKAEWIEKYNCYVCYAVHPSAALRYENNRRQFEYGIEMFSKYLRVLNGGDNVV